MQGELEGEGRNLVACIRHALMHTRCRANERNAAHTTYERLYPWMIAQMLGRMQMQMQMLLVVAS